MADCERFRDGMFLGARLLAPGFSARGISGYAGRSESDEQARGFTKDGTQRGGLTVSIRSATVSAVHFGEGFGNSQMRTWIVDAQ
jgi:hypothetical protein